MARIDYAEHQKEYDRLYESDPSLSVSDYCNLKGLKYASARRYIKRPKKAEGSSKPSGKGVRDKSSSQSKMKTRRSPAQQKWANYFRDFLVRATKNPSLTMVKFAEENELKAPTVRKKFKELRDDPDFRQLLDLYDAQNAQLSDMKADKRKKKRGSSKENSAGVTAHQNARTAQANKEAGIDPCADAHDPNDAHTSDLAHLYRKIMQRGDRFATNDKTNNHHGGYSKASSLVPEMLEIITSIDPLSVSHELLLARSQYLKMNNVINERMQLYEQKIADGERFYKEHKDGEVIDAVVKRDALLFGYAPRLRELEGSITTMIGLENRRAMDSRKQLIEEMKLPFHLPREEAEIVIQVLDLRERNNWDALTTAKNIERLGAKVPPALLLELKASMEEPEEEIIEGGTTIEELDQISADYYAKQEQYVNVDLPKRREEVAEATAKLTAQENGEEEFTANEIDAAAKEQAEYDDLEGLDSEDSDEGFESL